MKLCTRGVLWCVTVIKRPAQANHIDLKYNVNPTSSAELDIVWLVCWNTDHSYEMCEDHQARLLRFVMFDKLGGSSL